MFHYGVASLDSGLYQSLFEIGKNRLAFEVGQITLTNKTNWRYNASIDYEWLSQPTRWFSLEPN